MLSKLWAMLAAAKAKRCGKRGHQWNTDKTLSKRALPEHPGNNIDFEIFEYTKICSRCGTTYTKNFAHFRGGAAAFLNR